MKKDHEHFKKKLLEQRQIILTTLPMELGQTSESISAGDVLDKASEVRNQDFLLTLSEREREKLNEIEEALERIDEGVYGECESCGETIPDGRLEVRPQALLCVPCKSVKEKREKSVGTDDASGLYAPIDVDEFKPDQ